MHPGAFQKLPRPHSSTPSVPSSCVLLSPFPPSFLLPSFPPFTQSVDGYLQPGLSRSQGSRGSVWPGVVLCCRADPALRVSILSHLSNTLRGAQAIAAPPLSDQGSPEQALHVPLRGSPPVLSPSRSAPASAQIPPFLKANRFPPQASLAKDLSLGALPCWQSWGTGCSAGKGRVGTGAPVVKTRRSLPQ